MSKHSPVPFHRRKKTIAAAALGVAATLGAGVLLSNAFADVNAAGAPKKVKLPPVNAGFDYQIGGTYTPPKGVRVVSRDRTAKPVPGFYNICYVNAFQAQPDALGWWKKNHPELVLRDRSNRPVMDEDWGEALLDTSTSAKRMKLASVMGTWFAGCAKKDFRAIEPDNLDSYERSGGRLTKADNTAFATLLAQRAHAAGLAIAQKNASDLLGARAKIGFDFAVTEECGEYSECGGYAKAYTNRVFDIEYSKKGFTSACSAWGKKLSVARRDSDVQPRGASGYVYRSC
ncbi:endo alpha-1,4 polygalactosaminidase [Streptomyces collinus]|uniref:endo alpha-1,4 polygalactosaminidase n=1 Tax=Streptomyces collinus TaxID=42684 RepID=UPI0036B93F7A